MEIQKEGAEEIVARVSRTFETGGLEKRLPQWILEMGLHE